MSATSIKSRRTDRSLVALQAVLALLFVFAGTMKLITPLDELTRQAHLPGAFLRVIGVLEMLGGLGLVLPMLLHLRAAFVPLAAAGLVIVMSGAVGATLATGQVAAVAAPIIVGALLAVVAYARREWVSTLVSHHA